MVKDIIKSLRKQEISQMEKDRMKWSIQKRRLQQEIRLKNIQLVAERKLRSHQKKLIEDKTKNLEKTLKEKIVKLETELDFAKRIKTLEISVIEGRNKIKLKHANNEIRRLEMALEAIITTLEASIN